MFMSFKKKNFLSTLCCDVTRFNSCGPRSRPCIAPPLPSPPHSTPSSQPVFPWQKHAHAVGDRPKLVWRSCSCGSCRPSVARAARAHHSSSLITGGLLEFIKNKLHQTLIFLDFGCFYEFLAFTDQRLRVSNSSQKSAQKQDCSFIYLLYFSVQLKSTYISQTCFFINLNASITAVIHSVISLENTSFCR